MDGCEGMNSHRPAAGVMCWDDSNKCFGDRTQEGEGRTSNRSERRLENFVRFRYTGDSRKRRVCVTQWVRYLTRRSVEMNYV